MKKTIFLFDVDSVLVEPGGYRQTFWASLDYFVGLMGVETNRPTENDLEFLESIGVTSEWDMLPICVTLILNNIYELHPEFNSIDDMVLLFQEIKRTDLPAIEIPYRDAFLRLKDFLRNDITPCDSVLQSFQNPHMGEQLFPYVSNIVLLKQIFENSRDAKKSHTTRVFQNFILGDEKYREIYSAQELFSSEPMLKEYDQPLLNTVSLDKLIQLFKQDRLRFSIYTLRPSYPPREIKEHLVGYAPEAEMALSLIGFPEIPMITYGRLLYLANVHKLRVENLIKPSPVQALSAIIAAWTKSELLSMELAYQIIQEELPSLKVESIIRDIELPDQIDLHVFEDSAMGMRSAMEATKYLEQAGIKVDLSLWGIAFNEDKIKSLKSLNAIVHDDINQALTAAVTAIGF